MERESVPSQKIGVNPVRAPVNQLHKGALYRVELRPIREFLVLAK